MPNKKAKGKRAKTRSLFKNRVRPTVNKLLEDFKAGTRVAVKINSSIHSGMPHKRFHGLSGEIEGKIGKAFVVKIKHGESQKSVVINPVHLHTLGGNLK